MPFPPLDLIACSIQSREWRSGRFSHVQWRQVNRQLGGYRHMGWCPITVTHKLCVDQPQVYQTMELSWHCFMNVTVSSLWTRYYKKGTEILCWAPSPSVYLSLCHIIVHVLKSPRPSPSIFVNCKWSKVGWWQWPGRFSHVHWHKVNRLVGGRGGAGCRCMGMVPARSLKL